ncbi:hypothetical protein [Streptomyces sp. NPDC059761]|uniref:hypothetical protein n=1 Tax=Streptomyces sp. NPDC059761 TaxID=3346937 RepID=UPI00365C0F8F
MMSNTLERVTLAYTPFEGALQARNFTGLTVDDLVFVLASLHARTRNTHRSRTEATEALDHARKTQLEWYENQLRLSLEESLGRWHRLLPASIRRRIVEVQMEHYFDTTAQWAIELGDLYARVDRLEKDIRDMHQRRAQRAPVIGPRMLCGHGSCEAGLPIQEVPMLPHGWSMLASGGVRCPEHALAALAADAEQMVHHR